ncbi:hypothetical protein CC80DRAFT_537061 [Byssothecium circinans]|uniref:Uncharacterized protein n=1 Tax=Byssothecium circinans TaxID=147558 RepID=A0A6A5TPS0_9PLEO|nr:hypothetical protein CC80DRAFT_537061 [Byssothecium circinans]
MAPFQKRAAPAGQVSVIVFVAIVALTGIVVLGLCTVAILLVRARRRHKRLEAELDARGVLIEQCQRNVKRESITKPRAVLRRNTLSQYSAKSGWGALNSTDTINPPESASIPYYAPPKPEGFIAKQKRLSWPFSARRASGRAIHMRKIRVPVLSTVIESPKASPLVPVLSGSLGGEYSPRKSQSRPSSDQSLLQHHPAFRKSEDDLRVEPLRRSMTVKPVTKVEPLRSRSKSVAEIPVSEKLGLVGHLPRPKLHNRTASGNAPECALPPLPLDAARAKSETRRRSLLSRSPSRLSMSSFESAGSWILATQSSPIMRTANSRVQKVAKRDWRNSMIIGPRPIRDTLTLHGKNQQSQSSIKSSAARFSSVTSSTQPEQQQQQQTELRSSLLTNSSSNHSIGNVKTAESVTMSKVSSPAASPLTVRSSKTPKRRSGSFVTPYGSPEDRRKRSSILQRASGNHGAPERQLSQASTQASSRRSSNGNPFQWDPAPMSAGKPSNLKGSPSARKGHRRQNCVRISLTPTVLGPRSRSPSPGFMKEIQEESPNATANIKLDIGLGFSSNRSLPRPPSSSTFAPDLKLGTTSLRASLTPSSPTLSMANYDHGPIGSPIASRDDANLPRNFSDHRLSTGSVFCIPSFPSPCHDLPGAYDFASAPPTFALSRPSNEYDDYTSAGASSPFEMMLDINSSPGRPLLAEDEYDPERPHLIFQTPTSSPVAPRNFSSPISTIPEESSAQSNRTADYYRRPDSPPCSPKTIPGPIFRREDELTAFSLPISATAIPEELCDTIDPAFLSKEAFHSLTTPFDNKRESISAAPQETNGDDVSNYNSSGYAKNFFDPLIEAAFPFSPPMPTYSSRHQLSSPPIPTYSRPQIPAQESPSSMYLLSLPPSSPRPRHAELPSTATTMTPSLNFTNMPTLSPLPSGPRVSPPRPLRSSILKLRRMNSDAEKGGRGERRYLRLGREDSIALPGEESWLDGLDEPSTTNNSDAEDGGERGGEGKVDEEDMDETWDEDKGRRLVGNLLNDWEEDATILDLQDPTMTRIDVPSTPPSVTRVEEPKGLLVTSSPRPGGGGETTPRRAERSSSIWEDGEKFWASTPPFPPNSPNKPKQHFLPLSSSPLPLLSTASASSTTMMAAATTTKSRKRGFEVAKDEPVQERKSSEENAGSGRVTDAGRRESGAGNGGSRSRYRKRNALGDATPNVRIQVHPPSSVTVGTPGSLYDADGFLRG